MTKQKQGKQVLISLLLGIVLLFNCSSIGNDKIYGIWKVQNQNLTVRDDFKFMEEINPNILSTKFNKMFPTELTKGDQVKFTKNGKILINSDFEFFYKKSDTLISVMNKDIVYPLEYKLDDNEMILKRETYQGKIEWKLIRSDL